MQRWPPTGTNWRWRWSLPACAIAGTRLFRGRLLPVVGDFDHLRVASLGDDFGSGRIGVRVHADQNRVLRQTVRRVFKVRLFCVQARKIQDRCSGFLPRNQLWREMPEEEINAVGFFE